MKFELPPPLPERRATNLRAVARKRLPVLPKLSTTERESSDAASAARAELNGQKGISDTFSTPSTGSSPRRISSGKLVAGLAILIGVLVIVSMWIGGQKSPTSSQDFNRQSTENPTATPLPLVSEPSSTPSANEPQTYPSPFQPLYATPTPLVYATPPVYATPNPTPTASVMRASTIYHVVAQDYLNVRERPGSDSGVIVKLSPGTDGITITGRGVKNGPTLWVPILAGQTRGWVNKDYLAPSGPQGQQSTNEGQEPGQPKAEESSSFDGERYPQTRLQLLTEDDIKDMTPAELRYAINEVYARYGATFANNPDIRRQFQKFGWYHPNPAITFSDIDATMSDIEKQNVKLLGDYRDKLRSKNRP